MSSPLPSPSTLCHRLLHLLFPPSLRPSSSSLSPHLTALTILLPTLAAAATTLFLSAYHDWRALGPGGLPSSLRGFATVLYLHATRARSDTRHTDRYAQLRDSHPEWAAATPDDRRVALRPYLPPSGLPVRSGPRARARFWAIPQRERDVGDEREGEEGVREAYLKAVEQLVSEYRDSLEWRQSVLERRGQAVFLREGRSPPKLAARSSGEVLHVHASDSSGHVTLSFADAEEVIRKGWGERHRLSGDMLPLGYTFLFVPRRLDEVGVYSEIFRAGIEHMLQEK